MTSRERHVAEARAALTRAVAYEYRTVGHGHAIIFATIAAVLAAALAVVTGLGRSSF